MAPSISSRWTTDREYIDLLNYLIEITKDAKSPMSVRQMARDYKEKTGAEQGFDCFHARICKVREWIHSFQHINQKAKVQLLFALSASIDADFLKELKKDAFVEVDEKNRITYYKSNDGSLELRGEHSLSAKQKIAQLKSDGSLRSMIKSYFEKKNDTDAVPKKENEKEMWNLIEFIIEKCKHVNSPLNKPHLVNDFNSRFGMSIPFETIRSRVKVYCCNIQKMGFLDTHTKAQQLFGLSATIDSDYLETLRKEALVEVDEKNRITYYKSDDGSLELRGSHSLSAKFKTAKSESKGSHWSRIISYFKNKTNVAAVPENEEEKEMKNLIEFISEKSKNVSSPLSIYQLAKDFNNHIGRTIALTTTRDRIKAYCSDIQKTEFLDTHSKVQQLFGLGVRLDLDCLEELRKDAAVEVDDLNRITKYTANDGRLTLHGDHSRSAKRKSEWIDRRKNKTVVKKHSNFGGGKDEESDKDNGYSEDESDEYSSEEFDSEFDSDDENDHLDETEVYTEPSHEPEDFDNNTPVRNHSPTETSVHDNFDYDLPTERSHTPVGIAMREDEEKENDQEITENAGIKTRSGRLSKRRHLDSDFSYNLVNSRSSATPTSSDSTSSNPAKQKKIAIEKDQASSSSNQSRSSSRSMRRSSRNSSFPPNSTESGENLENQEAPDVEGNPSDYHGPRIQEMDDYDYNPREDNHPESIPIGNNLEEPRPPTAEEHNSNTEAQSTDNGRMNENVSHDDSSRIELIPLRGIPGIPNRIEEDSNIQQIPKRRPQVMEAPIKKENEEEARTSLKTVLNAFKSLALSLDIPALSQFQTELDKRIMESGRRSEVPNKEMIMAMDLLIVKLNRHGALKSPEDSISLRDILLMLRTIFLNPSFTGLEMILDKLKKNIEQLKVLDKKVAVSKVECVLRTTLDNICN